MRKRIILALAVTEGASSVAFVNSGWVASTRGDATSSRAGGWRGLNAHTLTLDVGSCMIPHPEKVARGEVADSQAELLVFYRQALASRSRLLCILISAHVLLFVSVFQTRLVRWHSRDDAHNRVRWHRRLQQQHTAHRHSSSVHLRLIQVLAIDASTIRKGVPEYLQIVPREPCRKALE